MFNRRTLIGSLISCLCFGFYRPKSILIVPYANGKECKLKPKFASDIVDHTEGKIFGAVWELDETEKYDISGFKVFDGLGNLLYHLHDDYRLDKPLTRLHEISYKVPKKVLDKLKGA